MGEILDKRLSLAEAGIKIKEEKTWNRTKEAFCQEVHVETWEDAQELYPLHSQREKLRLRATVCSLIIHELS